jgi:hypothetical protein
MITKDRMENSNDLPIKKPTEVNDETIVRKKEFAFCL